MPTRLGLAEGFEEGRGRRDPLGSSPFLGLSIDASTVSSKRPGCVLPERSIQAPRPWPQPLLTNPPFLAPSLGSSGWRAPHGAACRAGAGGCECVQGTWLCGRLFGKVCAGESAGGKGEAVCKRGVGGHVVKVCHLLVT